MRSASLSGATLVALPTRGSPLQTAWPPGDTLAPASWPHLTSSHEHEDGLRQEAAFQNTPKRQKERRYLLIHFIWLSPTDVDSLIAISSDTGEPGENIKDGLSCQWDPSPGTETICLAASGSFFLFCPRKRCFIPPRGNLSISSFAHLMGQRFSLLVSGFVNSVSFLSLRNALHCQPVLLGFCIMLQSWKEVGRVHRVGVERHLRREMPGSLEHVRQADRRGGKVPRHCVSHSHE